MKADSNLAEKKSFENSNGVGGDGHSNGVGDGHSNENGVYNKLKQKCTLSLVPGEELIIDSKIEFGHIKLTNYRILIRKSNSKWISVPLKSIESVEGVVPTLKILCKDVKIFEATFLSEAQYLIWEPKLQSAIKPLSKSLDAFAVKFYESMKIEDVTTFNALKNDSLTYEEHMEIDFHMEFERLGFKDSKVWRISNVNENYHLCETYPRHVIVPTLFRDDDLPAASDFRVNRRFPTPVWRHKNGAVLARSSQPSIGIFSNRSVMDERLLDSLSQACGIFSDPEDTDAETPNQNNGLIAAEKKLLVVDCRTFTSAFANRVRGGGYENIYNYKSAEIRHMNIPNIHTVQQAYTNLRAILFSPMDESKRMLKNDEWYDTISNIIYSALVASEALEKSRPVLVHCSDGWDRTPQITSLTAILLDPFYRTIRGFQTLVEREFIDFGHKFGERNEVVLKPGGEKSPIFLQFLECVYQLIVQFPTEFEFNNEYLMKLAQHIYSNLFGDFIFNTSCERTRADVRNKCFSVWGLFNLDRQRYVNILHNPIYETIKPSAFSVHLVIWKPFYTWFTKFLPASSVEDIGGSDERDVEPKRANRVPTVTNTDGFNFIEGDAERILLEKRVQQSEAKAEALEVELRKQREVHRQVLRQYRVSHENVNRPSLNDSVESGSLDQESGVSDSSWEAVEATEKPANWTPDHAAIYCMGCQVPFWAGLRKHHCRNCGKVFCDTCTRNRLPVPKENLHVPVRVCRNCVDRHDSPPRSPPMAVSN